VADANLAELKKLASHVQVVSLLSQNRKNRLAQAFLTGRSLTEGYFSTPEFARTLALWEKQRRYDLCLAVCSSTGAYFLKGPLPKRLIVDFVDVDSEKWRLYSQHHSWLEKWAYARESKKVAALETRLSELADSCITVSERECRHLVKIAPSANTLAIPNGVDTDYFASVESAAPIDRLVFVGQMDYFPNVEAVTWFAENVWQKLQQRLPALQWDIVGRKPTDKVKSLTAFKNVTVTGEVDDIRPWLRSTVAIAPIKLSCGVQNKVLEAMAAGRPVVASSSVADGFDDQVRSAILTAETPEKWISTLETLVLNHTLANRLGAAGRQLMKEHLTWDKISEAMRACVVGKPVGKMNIIFMDENPVIC
jgi:sugar transferase (PEP-CTERM/EpsH1 system associated)